MFPLTGLFHRSISQSGTAIIPWGVIPEGKPKAFAEQVAGLFNCPAHPSNRKQDAYKLYSTDRETKVSCHKHVENVTKLTAIRQTTAM